MRISDWRSDVCSSDLMEAVERRQDRLQGRSLHLQRLGDGDIPTLGMGMMLGPAPALGLQPPVELVQAGEPEPRLVAAAPEARKSVEQGKSVSLRVSCGVSRTLQYNKIISNTIS